MSGFIPQEQMLNCDLYTMEKTTRSSAVAERPREATCHFKIVSSLFLVLYTRIYYKNGYVFSLPISHLSVVGLAVDLVD